MNIEEEKNKMYSDMGQAIAVIDFLISNDKEDLTQMYALLQKHGITFHFPIDASDFADVFKKWPNNNREYLYILSHADPSGISDGTAKLSTKELVDIFRHRDMTMIIFASCISRDVAIECKKETGISCVGTTQKIDDVKAAFLVSEFLNKLWDQKTGCFNMDTHENDIKRLNEHVKKETGIEELFQLFE